VQVQSWHAVFLQQIEKLIFLLQRIIAGQQAGCWKSKSPQPLWYFFLSLHARNGYFVEGGVFNGPLFFKVPASGHETSEEISRRLG